MSISTERLKQSGTEWQVGYEQQGRGREHHVNELPMSGCMHTEMYKMLPHWSHMNRSKGPAKEQSGPCLAHERAGRPLALCHGAKLA